MIQTSAGGPASKGSFNPARAMSASVIASSDPRERTCDDYTRLLKWRSPQVSQPRLRALCRCRSAPRPPSSRTGRTSGSRPTQIGDYSTALTAQCRRHHGAGERWPDDVDLDCAEAVALAPYFLPKTDSSTAVPASAIALSLYMRRPDDPKASIPFKDETKKMIVELRMGGGDKAAQSRAARVAPFLQRASPGTKTAAIEQPCAALKASVTKIAVGAVLMRHWPPERAPRACPRHRRVPRARRLVVGRDQHLVDVVCRETDGVEWAHDHARTAKESAEHFASGGEARGFPWMKERSASRWRRSRQAHRLPRQGRGGTTVSIDGRPTIKVGS